VQMSYMAGRYEQMQQIAARRPYWQYSAVNDSRTRPSHRAMDGKVFRADDPIWKTWYPPNGYRCRCSVTSLSQKELDAEGLEVEKKAPIEITTGKPYQPDPGWKFNPAQDPWRGMAEAVVKDIAIPATPVILFSADTLARFGLKSIKEMDWESLPTGVQLPGKEELLRKGIDPVPFYQQQLKASLDMAGELVVLQSVDGSAAVFDELVFEHTDWENRGRYVPMVRETYEQSDEVWINVVEKENGGLALRKYHIKFYKSEEHPLGIAVVLDFERGVWRTLTVMPRERLNRIDSIRAGVCVFP